MIKFILQSMLVSDVEIAIQCCWPFFSPLRFFYLVKVACDGHNVVVALDWIQLHTTVSIRDQKVLVEVMAGNGVAD